MHGVGHYARRSAPSALGAGARLSLHSPPGECPGHVTATLQRLDGLGGAGAGQSFVTTLVVQDILGGDILKTDVDLSQTVK